MDDLTLNSLRRTKGPLLLALRRANPQVAIPDKKDFRCPFHEDGHASAGVFLGDDGCWRFKCQAPACGVGGDVFDIEARIDGKSLADVFARYKEAPEPARRATTPTPLNYTPGGAGQAPAIIYPTLEAMGKSLRHLSHTFTYDNPETGNIDLVVFRCEPRGEPKRFFQGHQTEGGFWLKGPDGKLPLYRRRELAENLADPVFFVEGEKKCDAVRAIGHQATTTAGGAMKAHLADLSLLAGRNVYLWPDCDPPSEKTGIRPGIAHMKQVAELLKSMRHAPRLFWIDPDKLGLPPKGDCADYLKRYEHLGVDEQLTAINEVIDGAEPMGLSRDVEREIAQIIAGEKRSISLPFPSLTRLVAPLLPGALMLLAAPPGTAKSFFIIQCCAHFHKNDVPYVVYMLEDDACYHSRRLLTQLSGQPGMTDLTWIMNNPDEARRIAIEFATDIDHFGRCLFTAGSESNTLGQLAEWVELQGAAGKRIVIIDPISVAIANDKPWIADQKFIVRIKAVAQRYGLSVIIVIHPAKGGSRLQTLDDMAGGAIWGKAAPSVLSILSHDPKRVKILEWVGGVKLSKHVICNRTVQAMKARNGPGNGVKFAFNFDSENLCFRELGMTVKEQVQQDHGLINDESGVI